MKKYLLCLMTAFSFLGTTYADKASEKEMIHDLEVARHLFEAKYAPKQWKKKHFGWSLDKSFLTAKKKVQSDKTQTIADYQKIFKEFILSTNDHHVNVHFHKTGVSWFPLNIKKVEGKYYITSELSELPFNFYIFEGEDIDFEKYEEDIEQLDTGDQILKFNNQPIDQVIEKIVRENNGTDRSPTVYALAEKMLFCHSKPDSETFTILVKHQGEETPVEYTLPWIRIPEWIKDQPLKAKRETELMEAKIALQQKKKDPKKLAKSLENLLKRDYSIKNVKPWLFQHEEPMTEVNDEDQDQDEEEDYREKGVLPELGEVIWENDYNQDLYAYLYLNEEGKKIGYLFFETFMPFFSERMVEDLVKVIDHLEQESDALVIDITNNPGGDAIFTYAVLSTLTDKPLACPTQQETLIQQDLYSYVVIQQITEQILKDYNEEKEEDENTSLPNFSGLVLNEKNVKEIQDYVTSLLKSWEKGVRFTKPHHLIGLSEIQPHPKANYTKPIMVLVNELCFSCADIFPAILQDNHRAVIFGKRTAGAGGYVRGYQHTSRFGVAGYSITGSLLKRTNGQVIENLGVTPDVPYELTVRDVREDFADYIERVNVEVNKLIKR